jgi:hypothetical protein
MTDKHKGDAEGRSPRSGRLPLASDIENARKQKILDERDENEDTEATRGSPESPANTGAERKAVNRGPGIDEAEDDDEADPAAIDEEMRNQDS